MSVKIVYANINASIIIKIIKHPQPPIEAASNAPPISDIASHTITNPRRKSIIFFPLFVIFYFIDYYFKNSNYDVFVFIL